MKKILILVLGAICLCCSCSRENDFLIMGRQEIFLDVPKDLDGFAPGYGGEKLIFRWHSKRHFAENVYIFSLDPELLDSATIVCGSTWQQSFLLGSQLDSVAAVLGVSPEETTVLFWQITTVDPQQGWCDEIRRLYFTRLPGVTKQILGSAPAPSYKFYCEQSGKKTLDFSWNCEKKIYDYVLYLSDDKEFEGEHTIRIELGDQTSYSINEMLLDSKLADWGYGIAQKVDVYWKVTGSGDAYIPVEESPRRTVKARRVAPPPVPLTFCSPAENAELDLGAMDGPVEFKWDADTTGVGYTLTLYDAEFDKSYSMNCGKTNSYSVSADEFDAVLGTNFSMVAAQRKKFSWSLKATPEDAVIMPEKPCTVIFIRK